MSDSDRLKRIFAIWREGERLDRKLKAMQEAIDEIIDSIEDPAVTTVLLNFIREAT